MRLQTKASVSVACVFTGLIIVVALVGRNVLTRDYRELEERDALQKIEQLQRLVDMEIDDLERSARDYAEWDDTVAFVEGRKPSYRTDNWIPDTLDNLKVDMVLAYSASGALWDGVLAQDGQIPPSEYVSAIESSWVARVLASGTAHAVVHGVARVGDGLAFVVCVPILPTGAEGEPVGCLVHVRWLNEAVLERLSNITGFPIRIEPALSLPNRPSSTPQFQRRGEVLEASWMLPGVDRGPVANISILLNRTIAAAGSRALTVLLVEITITAVLFALLVTVLIRWMVTARLERLSATLRDLIERRDGAARIPVEGSDEIALVARETNALLDAVALHQAEKERAHAEREALQQQLMQAQKMEAIGEFAGGIAHDFNNCLTSIISWVQLVHDELPAGHMGREGLADALDSARHATMVVRQLLLYSRPGQFAQAPLALGELVAESVGLMRSALPRSIELRVHTSGADDLVLADRTQLVQVLMNLLGNARDAMGSSGTLTISTQEVTLPDPACVGADQLNPGRYVRLSVQDTGPGISPANIERIFQPFFTTKPSGKGTGLGLAVVQSVVTRHRGGVSVTSVPGEGATFHIYLPHHVGATSSTESTDELPAGCRVLMAEDDIAVQRVLVRVLERHQCRVTCASSGSEAWRLVEEAAEPFDVVLTDLTMPGLTGMQLMERISNADLGIPVVLMTAYAASLDPKRVREAGFGAVLAKPMVMEEVAAALGRVVHEHRNRCGR